MLLWKEQRWEQLLRLRLRLSLGLRKWKRKLRLAPPRTGTGVSTDSVEAAALGAGLNDSGVAIVEQAVSS